MSQENVDAFRGTIEAVNRGDVPGVLRFADPEIQFEPQIAVLQGSYVGHDGLTDFYADIFETYELFQIQFSEVRDLGDQALAVGTARSVGKESGLEMEQPLAIVMSFRNGLITRFKDYGDKDRALEAAGLSE